MRALQTPRRLVAATLLSLWLVGGCYSYVPLREPVPAPAAPLRLRLSTPTDVRLADMTLHDVGEVDGELVAMQDSAVVLSATRVATVAGFERAGQGATVHVARPAISSIEIRKLSIGRTALVVGGLLALGVAADAALGGFPGFGSGGGGGGGVQK